MFYENAKKHEVHFLKNAVLIFNLHEIILDPKGMLPKSLLFHLHICFQ